MTIVSDNVRVIVDGQNANAWAFDNYDKRGFPAPQDPSGPTEIYSEIPRADLGNNSTVRIRRNRVENTANDVPILARYFGAENDEDYNTITRVRVFYMRGTDAQPIEGFEIQVPKRHAVTLAAVDEGTPEGSYESVTIRGKDFSRLTGDDLADGGRYQEE